jgi:hypothetical protein
MKSPDGVSLPGHMYSDMGSRTGVGENFYNHKGLLGSTILYVTYNASGVPAGDERALRRLFAESLRQLRDDAGRDVILQFDVVVLAVKDKAIHKGRDTFEDSYVAAVCVDGKRTADLSASPTDVVAKPPIERQPVALSGGSWRWLVPRS